MYTENMRAAIILGVFFVLVLSTLALAQLSFPDAQTFLDASFNAQGELSPELQGQLDAASEQFQQLPDPVKAIFGNQRVEIDLTKENGEVEHLGVVLQNNKIESFTRYPPANATMKINTDEQTALALAKNPDKGEAFVQAINSGKLEYKGLTSSGEVASWVANVVLWITIVVNSFIHFLGLN